MATMIDDIVIESPKDFVFKFIADYTNDIKWREGVIEMECSTKENISVGTNTRETMKLWGKTYTTIARVTEYAPYNKIAFRSITGKIPIHGYRLVESAGGYSRFIYSLTIEFKGLSLLLAPLMIRMYKKKIRRDLLKLKSILEPEYLTKIESFSVYKIPFRFNS
jgi:hypothetical protein